MNNNDILKKLKMKEKMIMDKYGYIIHHVPADSKSKNSSLHDSHTHGLKENFNHMDLQITLPIQPEVIGSIIHGMVESIKEGETFEDKLFSDKVIRDFNVQLVKVNDDNGRELLRIVLPDANGKFPGDEDCANIYKNQLDDLKFNKYN